MENRETRLFRLILGPGDNLVYKSYDENRSANHTKLLIICDLLATHHPPSTIPKLVWAMCGFVFGVTFSKFIPSTFYRILGVRVFYPLTGIVPYYQCSITLPKSH
jgi:hypothetical protein